MVVWPSALGKRFVEINLVTGQQCDSAAKTWHKKTRHVSETHSKRARGASLILPP